MAKGTPTALCGLPGLLAALAGCFELAIWLVKDHLSQSVQLNFSAGARQPMALAVAFRQELGCSPTDYRQQQRGQSS